MYSSDMEEQIHDSLASLENCPCLDRIREWEIGGSANYKDKFHH